MRAQISDGAWTVGNRVPTEPELMSVLGVGRNTVREAIKTLTSTESSRSVADQGPSFGHGPTSADCSANTRRSTR